MKIGIIGGGASGLVCAINAKRNDNEVIIFEKNKECAKKILATGNGKCNYWNSDQDLYHYESSTPKVIEKIITKNGEDEVLDFFNELGVLPKIKNGYYYPNSNQATTIKELLIDKALSVGVKIINNYNVESVIKKNEQFIINDEYFVDKLVIATGGYASPKTGSDGYGYEVLKKFNLKIVKPLPSLVQLKTSKAPYLKEWKGVRCDVSVKHLENNKVVRVEEGEIQLTDYGVSGICIFNLSNRIAKGLSNNINEELEIDFIPNIGIDKLKKMINKEKEISKILLGIMNNKLASIILNESKINSNIIGSSLKSDKLNNLINNIKSFKLKVVGTNTFDEAQVTSGGLSLDEIDESTMEVNKVRNLYVIGELLDLTGDCGGYNLGIAFRTAFLAARGINND